MLEKNMNNFGEIESVVSNGNRVFEEIQNLATKVTVDELLSDSYEAKKEENIWTKNIQENSTSNANGFNMTKTKRVMTPFALVLKEIMPPDGDYHFVLKNFEEDLNSVKPGGFVTSYCSFDFLLLSVDGIEYELKQVFSSKELSLKKFQMFTNSLLLALGVNEITNPKSLIGCTGECRIVNTVYEERRYVNISMFVQATLPVK